MAYIVLTRFSHIGCQRLDFQNSEFGKSQFEILKSQIFSNLKSSQSLKVSKSQILKSQSLEVSNLKILKSQMF